MSANRFYLEKRPVSLEELSGIVDATVCNAKDNSVFVKSVASVATAKSGDITFVTNRKFLKLLETSKATAVICPQNLANEIPTQFAVLSSKLPEYSFAKASTYFYPAALVPQSVLGETGVSDRANIHPSAVLESGVTIEANVTIGAGVTIGENTMIAAGAVISPNCQIGRNCHIASNVVIQSTLMGNNVSIHPNVSIGQDGFGYTPGPAGLQKIPQIGRVIIQDNVEIGSGTTIDRGALEDTVIGEGSKIDNLVQIAHNVKIGCYCLLASHVAIAGSTTIGNMVMIGGGSCIKDHLTIADGCQFAAMSGIIDDVPAQARWGGIPARPIRGFLRDISEMKARARGDNTKKGSNNG